MYVCMYVCICDSDLGLHCIYLYFSIFTIICMRLAAFVVATSSTLPRVRTRCMCLLLACSSAVAPLAWAVVDVL